MAIDSGDLVGGGVSLIMPVYKVAQPLLFVKTSTTLKSAFDTAGAYTEIETDLTRFGFETATLQQVANTDEQTIVDTTGEGVLTQILSPTTDTASSTITIRVTLDGVLTTFTDVLVTTFDVAIVGGFMMLNPSTSNGGGYGGVADLGYDSGQASLMLTPNQTIEKRGVGMVFKSSLKVTVQGSNALSAGSASNKCAVAWTTTIPEGL